MKKKAEKLQCKKNKFNKFYLFYNGINFTFTCFYVKFIEIAEINFSNDYISLMKKKNCKLYILNGILFKK